MKLSRTFALFGFGVSVVGAVAVAQGCSSPSSPAVAAAPAVPGAPPAAPTGAAKTTSMTEHNYALKTLFLGDTDRANVSSPTAWKNIGYNVDGKVTTKDSTDVCTLASGAAKSTQADGVNGIDNSFGENILPIVLTTAGPDASKKINDSIVAGSFTVMIDTTGFDDTPSQTATGLSGFLSAGSTFDPIGMTKPTFTTADSWPVRPELLSNPADAKSSTIKFPSAYVVDGTFVNGSPGTLTLNLAIGGVALDITITQAVITFDHKGPGQATNGTIAGVITTEDLISKLQKVAGRISTSLCMGQAFQSIAQQIRQASDIMADGTNNAGSMCNGISIGLGFEAAEIGIPSKVAMLSTSTPDPCAGGMDAGAPMDASGE